MDAWFADLRAGLDRLTSEVAKGSGHGMTSRGLLWLTPDEQRELADRLHALLQDRRGRGRHNHPEDAAPFDVYGLVLPAANPDDAPRG